MQAQMIELSSGRGVMEAKSAKRENQREWERRIASAQTEFDETKAMVEELKEMGVELMVSPYSHSVGKQSHNWAEAEAKKYLATQRRRPTGRGGAAARPTAP